MPLPKQIMLPSERKKLEKKRQLQLGGIGKYVRMLGNLLYPNYDDLISDLDKAGPKAQEKARTINEGLKSALDFVLGSSTLPPEQAIDEFVQNPNRLNDLKKSFAKEDVKTLPSAFGEEKVPVTDLAINAPEVALSEEIDQGGVDAPAEEEIEDPETEGLEAAESAEEIEGFGQARFEQERESYLEQQEVGDEEFQEQDEDEEQEKEIKRLMGGEGESLAAVVNFGLEIKRAAAGSRKMASGWNSPRMPGRFFGSKVAMIKAAWRETPTQYGRNPAKKPKPGDRSTGWCSKCKKTTSHELLEGGKEKCLEEHCGATLDSVTASRTRVVVRAFHEKAFMDEWKRTHCERCDKALDHEEVKRGAHLCPRCERGDGIGQDLDANPGK